MTEMLASLIAHPVESNEEFRIVRPSGEIRWARGRGAPVVGEDGSLHGFVGSITDATDERLAHQELVQLQRTIAATSDIITFHAPDGRIMFAERGGARGSMAPLTTGR